MTQQIHLAAIVVREGRLMLVRPQIGAPWELPGGPLLAEHEDVDAGMDAILTGFGIQAPAIEEDFIDTIYLPGEDGQIVYNLYAASEWRGEPYVPAGTGLGWFGLDELEAIMMDNAVREAVLVAFGVRDPKPPQDAEVLKQMQAAIEAGTAGADFETPVFPAAERAYEMVKVPQAAPPVEQPPLFSRPTALADNAAAPNGRERNARREAGLDVLKTLGGGDPVVSRERMLGQYPELADDVVDFALGDVWSNAALDRKTRSLEVVAMLAALGGRQGPLRSHINGALNHGASAEEIVQTLRMVAVYAGFPAAIEAWGVMEGVFEQRQIPRPGRQP